jgi:O-antigen ligase
LLNIFKNLDLFLLLSVCLIPIFLFSPFISGSLASLAVIIFLIISFQNKYNFFNNKFFILFNIWYVYLLVCSIFSSNIELSFESSLFYFRFGILSLCVLYLDQEFKFFKKYFFISLSIILVIIFFDSFYQYNLGFNILGFELTSNRVSSFFNTEKILGSYINKYSILFMSLFIILYNKIKFFNIYFMFIIILLLSLVIISSERTALFTFFLFIIFCQIFIQKSLINFFLSSISFILIIIIFFSFNPSIKKRLISESLHQTNLVEAFQAKDWKKLNMFSDIYENYYYTGYKIFKDHFFFGSGPKMFRELCANDKYFIKDGCSTHPHNTYIQLLAETGLVGASFILLIWIFTFIYLFYYLINIKISYRSYIIQYKLILIFGLFIVLFPFIPTGSFFNNHTNIYNFLLIGFLISTFNKNLIIYKK